MHAHLSAMDKMAAAKRDKPDQWMIYRPLETPSSQHVIDLRKYVDRVYDQANSVHGSGEFRG